MRNPPHPGLVLREYLGDLAVSAAAAHRRVPRVTLSRGLNAKAGIRGYGDPAGGRSRYDAGTVDEHAVAVRPLVGAARTAAIGAEICARCRGLIVVAAIR